MSHRILSSKTSLTTLDDRVHGLFLLIILLWFFSKVFLRKFLWNYFMLLHDNRWWTKRRSSMVIHSIDDSNTTSEHLFNLTIFKSFSLSLNTIVVVNFDATKQISKIIETPIRSFDYLLKTNKDQMSSSCDIANGQFGTWKQMTWNSICSNSFLSNHFKSRKPKRPNQINIFFRSDWN